VSNFLALCSKTSKVKKLSNEPVAKVV